MSLRLVAGSGETRQGLFKSAGEIVRLPDHCFNWPNLRPALDAETGVSLQFGHQRPDASDAGRCREL